MSGREKRIATLNAVQEQRKQNCLVRTEKAIAEVQKKGSDFLLLTLPEQPMSA